MAIIKEMIFGNYKKNNENSKTEENMVWLDMDKMIEFRESQPFPMHSGIKEKQIKFTGKISKDTLKKYKEKFNSNDEFDELVNKLLEEFFNESEVTSL